MTNRRGQEEQDYNTIREWLTPLLESHGMSVEDLAKKIGATRTSVYYWLDDTCRPSSRSMAKVCDVLGRPFEEGLRQYTERKQGRPVGYSPTLGGARVRAR